MTVYDGSRRYLQAASEAGLRRAVVSSSANTEQVLQVTRLDALIAEVGVQAGRAGGFGHVIGVDRTGHAQALREHGADVVVTDLAELL